MFKNSLLAFSLLYTFILFAQDSREIAEAEMKAAYKTANFTASQNTGNYDVNHHTLELTVNPAVQFVTGKVTTTFTALSPMDEVTFDLNNDLNVSTVTQGGNALIFTQNNDDELVISLATTVNTGQQATVVISYSGAPAFNQDAFEVDEHNGIPVLWTLSEPYGAKNWWPCKQDLIDKIESLDVYITAPSQYKGVSNGLEQSETNNGNGTKTVHYHHSYPIPAYLVAIAVTNYTIYTQQAGTAPNTFPIINYFYPENAAQAQEDVAVTLPIMEFFETLFETYPFHEEKYGHAQANLSGGMEHSTVSFVNNFGRNLIAHELAHQWFGDKVTCGSWQDLWLNEGFATYLTGLTTEHLDGDDEFKTWKFNRILYIISQPDGSVYIPAQDTLNESRLFSSRLTYDKGGMVLHMLRYKLGEDNFYQGVRNYLADPGLAYAYAVTPQLQSHLEATSGQGLDEFFNDWVYGEGYPSYSIQVTNAVFGEAVVTVNQTTSHPSVNFFEMPVPIRFFDSNGNAHDVVLENTFNGQEFVVSVPFTVAAVEFNPDFDIIAGDNTTTLSAIPAKTLAGVQLYPNPASTQLHLQLPQGITVQSTTFYNALGQTVLQTKAETVWNVTRLSAGVHFVTVVTDKGTRRFKFIKE